MHYLELKGRLTYYARAGILFVCFLLCKPADSQTLSQDALLVSCSNNDSIITINYQPSGVVYNLLVQISDSGGRTIFLENKYKISGRYQCKYNASVWKEDFVYVQLIADDKRFNKKIKLR